MVDLDKYEYETISIHVGDTGDFISIDNEKCNNCGRCLVICIKSLWRKKDGKVYIAENYKTSCVECGSCAEVCGPGAITFSYPAGGTGVVYEKG